MVGGVLLTALVFEILNSKSGDIKAWVKTKLNDTTFINKVNTVVENSITKVFSKADQYALLSGKIEKVLESLKDGKGVDSVVAELKTWCENSQLKAIETGNLKVIEVRNPDIANSEWLARGYDIPPYHPQYQVKIVEAGNEEYVRVFSYNLDGTSNKLGGWLMKKSDIKGLSPAQIADRYALPAKPTHICDVKLKPTTKLQTGIANPVKEWGIGGGQQFDTLGNKLPVSSFVNERLIGE